MADIIKKTFKNAEHDLKVIAGNAHSLVVERSYFLYKLYNA